MLRASLAGECGRCFAAILANQFGPSKSQLKPVLRSAADTSRDPARPAMNDSVRITHRFSTPNLISTILAPEESTMCAR